MSQIKETFHYDESEDRMYIQQVQDVEPILDANKRAMNNDDGKYHSEVFNLVADIPEVIALKWCRDKGIPWSEFLSNKKVLRRFLNDPDVAFCRTRKGRI